MKEGFNRSSSIIINGSSKSPKPEKQKKRRRRESMAMNILAVGREKGLVEPRGDCYCIWRASMAVSMYRTLYEQA